MPSQELLYAIRNCFSFKLEQILTIYNFSKHSLLNNLYNYVEAVVISTTSSIFFIQCTGLTMMWILCLAVWWDLPATNFCTRNCPTQKGWQRVYFQSSRYPSKLMMGSSLKCYHQQWGTEFPPTHLSRQVTSVWLPVAILRSFLCHVTADITQPRHYTLEPCLYLCFLKYLYA